MSSVSGRPSDSGQVRVFGQDPRDNPSVPADIGFVALAALLLYLAVRRISRVA
ncbi:hypothetical protein G3I60_00565 [Streptomyces sp. SID13666]|uniref:hypothetical protein n=1 Tax=unclassified Streptomyces TaxID=2593676 RepID=UPI0013BF57C4|nr:MULTISPECIES: hypothetical protein [unclassified Streptomyces]NEA52704.1 hypothetical protein [Streptomyces sp. SID13666]NEA69969.1 hypothetical protein [Streptomyces sp. SID13588]QNA71344.1 hypothetical protein C8250_004960 [Streptomyces sp. So13.3]